MPLVLLSALLSLRLSNIISIENPTPMIAWPDGLPYSAEHLSAKMSSLTQKGRASTYTTFMTTMNQEKIVTAKA